MPGPRPRHTGQPEAVNGADHSRENDLLPDLSLYERLIGDGLASAETRGGPVDHVTARRLAIWLAARPQRPAFARGLVRFTRTGEITPTLKAELRLHARSGTYQHQPQAAPLMEYATARGTDLGPIAPDFGAACHQIDRADLMLTDLRDRIRRGLEPAQPAWPDTDGPPVIALARHDPDGNTVSLILDTTTADIALHAIAAHAGEREAHLREVKRYGQNLPDGSWGRRNRQAIATRETRIATRLRAIEHAYRTAADPDAIFRPIHPARPLLPRHTTDREIELE